MAYFCKLISSCFSFFRLKSQHKPSQVMRPDKEAHADASSQSQETVDVRSARRFYLEKIQHLEHEVRELTKLLNAQKNLLMLKTSGCSECRARIDEIAMEKLIRLHNGGYVYGIMQPEKPGERLFLHLSEPGISDLGSDFPQILRKMASIGVEKLDDLLRQTIPLSAEISGRDVTESKWNFVSYGSECGLEGILVDVVEELAQLALEGLRIQMEPAGYRRTGELATRQLLGGGRDGAGEVVVMVVMMQVRDAMQDYEEIGNMMIGLVEASLLSGGVANIEGLHVAGIRYDGDDDATAIWSGSLEDCMDSCCYSITRNLDIAFAL